MVQIKALCATAFFLRKLEYLDAPNLDIESIKYDAIFDNVYRNIRQPKETGGLGDKYPDRVFDGLPYIYVLLQDLGLKVKSKKSFLKEMFEPYQWSEYRGLVQEWKGHEHAVNWKDERDDRAFPMLKGPDALRLCLPHALGGIDH